jgi:hypothetical protein
MDPEVLFCDENDTEYGRRATIVEEGRQNVTENHLVRLARPTSKVWLPSTCTTACPSNLFMNNIRMHVYWWRTTKRFASTIRRGAREKIVAFEGVVDEYIPRR